MSNEFTRSYVGEGGNSLKDSTYQLVGCAILPRGATSKDAAVDITRMIGFIRIHESLFNPSLFFEIGIRDDYNFFEEFDLRGTEIIALEFETRALGLQKMTHKYEVHVTKINDYARGDSQVHAYTLIGVSNHAFLAPLTKTSMVCIGETTKNIRLLCDSIGMEVVRKPDNVEAITKTQIVFGMKNPLKAALELLSVSVDQKKTPYFLYQTLSNIVYLAPLSWMINKDENPVYRTLTYTDQQKSNPNSELEYFERSSQIVKLSSNIGASPAEQLVQGGGPRTLNELNLDTKVPKKVSSTGGSVLTTVMSLVPGPPVIPMLAGLVAPFVKHRYTQPNANDNPVEAPTLSMLKAQWEDHLKAEIISYDAMSHQFSIMGDMFLNPGRTVNLQFPKALDPATNPKQEAQGRFDKRLSKDYLIFQAVHTFQEGKHTTDITAKASEKQKAI